MIILYQLIQFKTYMYITNQLLIISVLGGDPEKNESMKPFCANIIVGMIYKNKRGRAQTIKVLLVYLRNHKDFQIGFSIFFLPF